MREEQKRNEFPAENALAMKPAFTTEGNTTWQGEMRHSFMENLKYTPLIPDICIAITNGDCAEKPVPVKRSVLFEGTMSPAMKTPRIYWDVRGYSS
jgi:hypothetical protein